MIFNYNQFLNEKLMPSQYRKYVKQFNKERYKDIFQKYKNDYDGDKNAYRIYLPLLGGENEIKTEIENFLLFNNYNNVDYNKGTCQGTSDKIFKIGKVLTRLKADDLLKKFVEDPKRKAGDDLLVCISRHPYDIAGSDTDRNWTNCMTMYSTITSTRNTKTMHKIDDIKIELAEIKIKLITLKYKKNKTTEENIEYQDLMTKEEKLKIEKNNLKEDISDRIEQGENVKYLIHDVKEGSLISYLIKSDDKNINNPIAVLNIKPFINEKDENDIILLADKKGYGNATKDFLLTVNVWLDELNKDKSGSYKLNKKLYNDGRNVFDIFTEESYTDMKNMIIDNINSDDKINDSVYQKLRDIDKDKISDFIQNKGFLTAIKYINFLTDKNLSKYKTEILNTDDRTYAYILYKIKNNTYTKIDYLIDKDKIKNYLKNCGNNYSGSDNDVGHGSSGSNIDYIDLLTYNEILDVLSSDDIFEILKNKNTQAKISTLLIVYKINFEDVINKLDIKTFDEETINRILNVILDSSRIDDYTQTIIKLFNDNVFEIQNSYLIFKPLNTKHYISNRVINLLKSHNIKLKEMDERKELINIFDKYKWEEIIKKEISNFPYLINEIQYINKIVYGKEIDLNIDNHGGRGNRGFGNRGFDKDLYHDIQNIIHILHDFMFENISHDFKIMLHNIIKELYYIID